MIAPLLATLLAATPGPSTTPTPTPSAAATPAPGSSPAQPLAAPSAPAQGPDVELHVPRAEVKKVALEVENLQARLNVDTRVANLVQISAGVVATVEKLKVELDDVAAETHLVVRLDRVAEVMSRALATLDQHPDLAVGPGAAPQPLTALTAGAATEAAPRLAPLALAVPAGSPTGVKP